MSLRIEDLTEANIADVPIADLHSLRMRCAQMLSKSVDDNAESRYRLIRSEFEKRETEIKEFPIDRILKAKDALHEIEKQKKGDLESKIRFDVKIFTKSEDERIVSGVVYAPNETDSQGDFATAEEIKKAAYGFMESLLHTFKQNHIGAPVAATILETYLAPIAMKVNDQEIPEGAWVLTTRVNDPKIWEDIKKGEITGYSMAGSAVFV